MKEKTILLVLHFYLVLPTVAALNCSNREEWLALQSNCFTDRAIELLKLQKFNEHVTFQIMHMFMENYMKENGDAMCQKQEDYEKAVGCLVDAHKQCTRKEYLDYIPDYDRWSMIVPTFCTEMQKISYDCVKNLISRVLTCIHPESEPDHNHCRLFSETFDCQAAALKGCGCVTVKAFETMHVKIFHPKECPADEDRQIIDCDAVGRIVPSGSGGGELSDHAAVSLIVSLGLFAFEIFV